MPGGNVTLLQQTMWRQRLGRCEALSIAHKRTKQAPASFLNNDREAASMTILDPLCAWLAPE
jgi:hypothetical protein